MQYRHRLLRILNSSRTTSLIGYLMLNFDKLVPGVITVNPQMFFEDLGKGLAELHETELDRDQLKALARLALEADYRELVRECKHEVGTFLVELMRVCNQNLHDRGLLVSFRRKLEELGIPWKGQPDECIEHITFSGLQYMKGDGGYVYTAV